MVLANAKLGQAFVPKAVQAMILAQQAQPGSAVVPKKPPGANGSHCDPCKPPPRPPVPTTTETPTASGAGGGNAGGGNGSGQNPGSQQPDNSGGGASWTPTAAAAPAAAPQPAATPAAAAPTPAPAPVAAAAPAPSAPVAPPAAQVTPTYVYVLFQQTASAADMASFLQAYKASIVEGPSQDQVYKLQLTDPVTPDVLSQTVESMKTQTNIVSQVVTN